MRIEGVLLIVTPALAYGALVMLPPDRGYPLTRALTVLLALCVGVSMALTPTPGAFDIRPFIATLIATILFASAAGAFGYHAVARRQGPSVRLRLLFLGFAALLGGAIFAVYQAMI